MTRKETIEWAKNIDSKYSDQTTKYGAYKNSDDSWNVSLWHPLALEVEIVLFDRNNSNKEVGRIKGLKKIPNWSWNFRDDMEGMFYQFSITQSNGDVTIALDPFAKSMAAFDWEANESNVGKAAFVSMPEIRSFNKLNEISNPQPIIYEANIRDLTSLRNDVSFPGSFSALKEAKIAEHIKDLGFTSVQFLPVHNCYSLNESDKTILQKGEGSDWATNYNWGYDPHNYFSINGWYSSNPSDPYSRMHEFKDVVSYMHENDLNVIVDVVYNHLMTNKILNNVFPDYYFRGGSDSENITTPVTYPPLATEREMCRRIIIDSLEWFVKTYDVDGFRFDLSCFIDKETLYLISKKLKKIKPNMILHGEAWPWSDLNFKDSLIKGVSVNNIDFAYFNDSTRNSIKGEDDDDKFESGIIGGKIAENFDNYLASIIGNISDFPNPPIDMPNDKYSRFANNPNMNLQYASCHDGHTLWDKINLTTKGDKIHKIEALRQSMIMQHTTQGRILYLAGSELLYSKPNDDSGADSHRWHESENAIDLFGLGKRYNENTYKTTDYSNGIRWNQLNSEVKENVYNFLKNLNIFRKSTDYFNLSSDDMVRESINFINVNKGVGIIDFNIKTDNDSLRVIHNFGSNEYVYKSDGKIIFDSKLSISNIGMCKPRSSQIIIEEVNNDK